MTNSYVAFDDEQLNEILSKPFPDGVLCLNLLKFRNAVSVDGKNLSGAETYQLYAEKVVPLISEVGGVVVALGDCDYAVIGPKGEWDSMIIVWYPSAEAFHSMVTSEIYRNAVEFRNISLDDSRLIPIPAPPGYSPSISAIGAP